VSAGGVPVSSRVLRRLRAHGLVPEDAQVVPRRTFASGSMRVVGAWSWVCTVPSPNGTLFSELAIGSQVSMAEVMAAPYWDLSETYPGQITIDPCTSPDHDHQQARHRDVALHALLG
jgi:hypothetical protein